MKRSRDYYLKRLEKIVEARRERNSQALPGLSRDTAQGMISVFDDYLFSLWLSTGDTAFNRLGYRNATDDLLEQLRQHA